MLARVFALLLFVALLGLRPGVEHAPQSASLPDQAAVVLLEAAAGHEGAPTHPLADESPSQALGEASSETPALLPGLPIPAGLSLRSARPVAFASAAAAPPFLAGPLRPPCAAALAA